MVKFSIPFLAKNINQMPLPGKYDNQSVEAVLFNREDLEKPVWDEVWKNIHVAARLYGSENVTFHFPVNNSDYVAETFVADRLKESLARASDLGLNGIVVHSNRIRDIDEWSTLPLAIERTKVIDCLSHIRGQQGLKKTWLALENMPVMDNYGKEIDPLFIYPSDFQELNQTDVKVVWDACHFTNTITNIEQVINRKQNAKYYPNIQQAHYLDFLGIQHQIAHWHFSAFSGICNPDEKTFCKEGVLPSESTLGEDVYRQIMSEILKSAEISQHITFEIQEECYINRMQIIQMLKWVKNL
jgi:hypothetical protein